VCVCACPFFQILNTLTDLHDFLDVVLLVVTGTS